jgi:hypothetical protein
MESTVPVVPSAEAPGGGLQRPPWKTFLIRGLIWAAIVVVCAWLTVEGLRLRYWTFQTFDTIRFIDDARRGTFWGLHASGPEGYLNQYDKMDIEVPEWQDSRFTPWLDYGPLRLAVMTLWGYWQRAYHPPDAGVALMDAWQRPYWFNTPVIRFNLAMEETAAVCAFLLTWHWVRRGTPVEERRHFLGVWQGLVAAALVWFSPDLIINAHGWPQWDNWVVPWYLLALLLASLDWWFAAGVAIAIGANLKGQMLSVAAIFVIWPLVQGRVGAAARWVVGLIFCYGLITSGWLLTYIPPPQLAAARAIQADLAVPDYPDNLFAIARHFDFGAAIWIFEMVLAAAAVPWVIRALLPVVRGTAAGSRFGTLLGARWIWIAAGAAFIFAAVYWPWLAARNRWCWYYGVLASGAVAAAALAIKPRYQLYVLAGIVGCGLQMCMLLFHATTAWWDIAVHFGAIHWPFLFTGAVSNVPAIYQIRLGWPREIDEIAFTLPAIHAHWPAILVSHGWWPAVDHDVTAKTAFNTVYLVLLLVSGIAIGIQTKRNDRRALIAFVTPWVMWFLFPVQIQERYLLYGAGAAACCIGESVAGALLGLGLTIFSLMMPFKELLDIGSSNVDDFGQKLSEAMPLIFSPGAGHTLQQYLDGTQPDIAWGILVIGLIFLYLSVTPSRRRRRPSVTRADAAPAV